MGQVAIDGVGDETWTYLTTDHLGTPLLATDDAGEPVPTRTVMVGEGDTLFTAVMGTVRSRFLWLAVHLGAAFLAASVISGRTLEQVRRGVAGNVRSVGDMRVAPNAGGTAAYAGDGCLRR